MPNSKEEKLLRGRAKHRDAQTKELMREKISFTKTLTSIDDAEETLLSFIQQKEDPSNARIGAIKALLDSKWKKMNKQLPDLKAVELTGKDGGVIDMTWKVEVIDKTPYAEDSTTS